MAEIELHPGTASCDIPTLNRLVQQQQLGIPIARALIYDEICQAVVVSQDDSDELVRMYLDQQAIEASNTDAVQAFLQTKELEF